jgi:hypothetical protein
MKILFVITGNGHGRGGHVNSLDHISRAVAQKADIKIVSIGLTESPVLKENPYYFGVFKFKWFSYFTLQKKFKELFKTFNPDVIHCFDGSSALLLMALPGLFSKKVIYTKCGGPNERKSIAQITGDIVLFSQENYDSYRSNNRFKYSDIHLIPNRVLKVDVFPEDEREVIKDANFFNFVRIARISKAYENSIKQAIELTSRISSPGKKVKLYIIGVIQDEEIFNGLKEFAETKKIEVEFVTNHLTNKASRMLYLADAVIGTGRGVMEAMTLGIPTFVPVNGRNLPELLTSVNFHGFLSTNFSPRGTSLRRDEIEIVNEANNLVNNKKYYKKACDFSLNIANKEFVFNEEVILNYLSIYRNVMKKENKLYILKNILPFIYYLNVFRRVQNRLK